RQLLGADHPSVAADVFLLGQILLWREKDAEAETTMREAVELYRKIHDRQHPYQGLVMLYYAQAMIRKAKVDDVEAAVVEASGGDPSKFVYRDIRGRIQAWHEGWPAAADDFVKGSTGGYAGVALVKAGRLGEYISNRSKPLEQLAAPRGSDFDYHLAR